MAFLLRGFTFILKIQDTKSYMVHVVCMQFTIYCSSTTLYIYMYLAKSSCLAVPFQEMVVILVLLTYLLLPLKLSLVWRQCCYNVQGSPAT